MSLLGLEADPPRAGTLSMLPPHMCISLLVCACLRTAPGHEPITIAAMSQSWRGWCIYRFLASRLLGLLLESS
eukprot:5809426-Amphidinium_carterae.1